MTAPKSVDAPYAHLLDVLGRCVPMCPTCQWMKRQEEIRASLPLWFKRLLGFTETLLLLLVLFICGGPFSNNRGLTMDGATTATARSGVR